MSPEASIALVGGKAQGARTDAKFGHASQLDIGDEYAQQEDFEHRPVLGQGAEAHRRRDAGQNSARAKRHYYVE
ncbi:hypothetical protein N8077_01680 [Myxococcota bacterium]|nr:hypothetical protein [Myxococcota bacterium]